MKYGVLAEIGVSDVYGRCLCGCLCGCLYMIIVDVIDIYSRYLWVGRVECSVVGNCIQGEWEH